MDKALVTHYRTYAKIYGAMIIEAVDDDEFIRQLIEGHDLHPLLEGLRVRIEESERFRV